MFFIDKIYNYNVIFFWLIISGGLAYTFGVIFYSLSEKVKYFHFVWHLFVMAGTILHAIAIIKYIYV
jgi:hemolysin III